MLLVAGHLAALRRELAHGDPGTESMNRGTVSSFQLPSLARRKHAANQVMGAHSFYWKILLLSQDGRWDTPSERS